MAADQRRAGLGPAGAGRRLPGDGAVGDRQRRRGSGPDRFPARAGCALGRAGLDHEHTTAVDGVGAPRRLDPNP